MLSHTKFQNLDTVICQCVHKVSPAMVTRVYSNQISSILHISDKLSYGTQRRIYVIIWNTYFECFLRK